MTIYLLGTYHLFKKFKKCPGNKETRTENFSMEGS